MIPLRSKLTIKILNYYFLNPEARHYVNELAKMFDLDPKNLYRKLRELEDAGLFQSEFRGKERFYFLNKKFPLLDHYRQIILKTLGLEQKLREIITKIPKIDHAFIFGSYARNQMDPSSDIDLLIIGDYSIIEFQKRINQLQKETSREFNVVNLGPEELKRKKSQRDQFLANIFKGKTIKLL